MNEQQIKDEAEKVGKQYFNPIHKRAYEQGFHDCAQWLLSQQGEGKGMIDLNDPYWNAHPAIELHDYHQQDLWIAAIEKWKPNGVNNSGLKQALQKMWDVNQPPPEVKPDRGDAFSLKTPFKEPQPAPEKTADNPE